MPNFRFEHRIEVPIKRVFDFHADPANLSALHQGWKGFRLLHHRCLFPENSTLWFEQTVFASGVQDALAALRLRGQAPRSAPAN